ncbi:MAG: pH regulation protein F [Crenarchaeota archaeon]|nr:pH regulation protein F [Thermoproteota archaeon]
MSLENEVLLFITIVIPIFLAAFIMYIVRALKGPTIPDIVLAVDCLSYDLAAFLALLSIYFRSPILIPCAIVLALWIYALDVYVSKYLMKKEMGE